MRVFWPHTFNPAIKDAGAFMFQLVEPLREQGVEVVPFYMGDIKRRPIAFLKALPAYRQQARSCDLVHAQYGSMCGLLSLVFPGKKILSLRGSDWYRIINGGARLSLHSFLARVMTRISLPFYDCVVVMSRRMQRDIGRISGVLRVIPDGIDLSHFHPMDKRAARRQLGWHEDGACVLFISAVKDNPIKRLFLAQAAIDIVKTHRPDVTLVVAQQVDHAKMPLYVNSCDALLCTSTHEGWPNSIKEALACNVPFVSTDVSDLYDIALKEPSCHVVIDDARAIARALDGVLSLPEAPALRRHVEPMDVRQCAGQLKALYQEMLTPRR